MNCSLASHPATLPRGIALWVDLFQRKIQPTVAQADYLKTVNNAKDGNQYKKNYHITGTGTKSFVSMKTNTNHTIETDVPKKMGGGDEAPQPVETLLAAWVGCTQATALYVGRNMEPRLLIDRIEFDVEAYRGTKQI